MTAGAVKVATCNIQQPSETRGHNRRRRIVFTGAENLFD